ncbi:MAG: rhomboid family intramembrane serine protease [Synoicihabitans sp.]
MLSDRSYMRSDYPRQTTSVLTWLLCAIVAGFILQNVFWKWLGGPTGRSFDLLLALSPGGILTGKLWTLVTYSLLHSMTSFLHVVFNLLWIYLLGKELLPALGSKRFLWLYFAGVVGGGLLWLAASWNDPGLLVGASAGVCALLMVFAAMNPNRQITMLLFFIIPVTIKPKWLVIFLGAFDLLGFLFYEIPGGAGISNIAHSAHLGGFATGWIFFRYVHNGEWGGFGSGSSSIELPGWLKRKKQRPAQTGAYTVNVGGSKTSSSSGTSRHVDLRAEVDRILDKINTSGFGALTDEEKRILDRAKDSLNRR